MTAPIKRRIARSNRSGNKPVAKDYPEGVSSNTLEAQDPEAAGAVLADLAIDPAVNANVLAERLGVPKGVVEGFLRRARTRYVGLKDELYKIDNKGLQSLIDDRAFRLLKYMDDDLMMQGSLRDITYAFDRIMNMRQLLKGEPTAILSTEDRQGLNKLVPLMLKEAQRRGMVMDGEFSVVGEDAQ